MKRLLCLFILVLIPLAVANAQEYPPPVSKAIDDLGRRLNVTLTPADFNWRWSQQIYRDSSLDCPQPGQTYTQGNTIGYQVTLYYNNLTWDYRVSGDLQTLILCSPLATPTPTPRPTNLPPTARPTLSPAPNSTATPTSCPSSPAPRLVIGQQARVLPELPNIVRQSPGTSGLYLGELPVGDAVYVVDGPHCASNMAWWFVVDTTSDLVGWTSEGQGSDYWMIPIMASGTPETLTATTSAGFAFATNTPGLLPPPITPTLSATSTITATFTSIPTTTAVVCAPQIPPRLVIGREGQVTPGLPNNLRQGPGTSTTYVGEIPPGGVFTVLDGPRCASGMAWWQVNYNGLTGWTPEGQGSDYWLEPIN